MKSQVLSRVLSPVFQEMFTSSSCPALSLRHLGTNFSREGTEVERQEGTGKKETTPPYRKGTHYYLTFCPLNDLYCCDLLAWRTECWLLRLFSSFRHKDLTILETTPPSETHSLYKNLKPRSLNFLLPTPLIKCFWAYAPSIHTCIHRLYIFLIMWKCRMIIKYHGGRGELRMRWKIIRKWSTIFLPTLQEMCQFRSPLS